MRDLHVIVNNKIATYLTRDGSIVCRNSDYRIVFSFDSEWDTYGMKVARFIWNNGYRDVPFTGNAVTVPEIANTTQLEVGVYAGDLSTTTPAVIDCKGSILCKHGLEEIPEPTPELYQQILTECGLLAARVDNLATLKEGSTTGDAELLDIHVGYDGTIYHSAGAAVRGQVSAMGKNVDTMKSVLVTNILDKLTVAGHFTINGNGVIQEQGPQYATAYSFKVSEYIIDSFSVYGASDGWKVLAFYSSENISDATYIDGIRFDSGEIVSDGCRHYKGFAIPENAVVGVIVNYNYYGTDIEINGVRKGALEPIEYAIARNEADIAEVKKSTDKTAGSLAQALAMQPNLFNYSVGNNLLDISLLVQGKYVSAGGGNIGENASAFCTEEYIDISSVTETHLAMYKCNKHAEGLPPFQTYWRCAFYDKDKNFISGTESSTTNDLTAAIVEIPVGAKYVRVSFLTYDQHLCMIVPGSADMDLLNYEEYKKMLAEVPLNLNEELAKIPIMVEALADMRGTRHKDNAVFTVTELDNTNQFNQNDFTFVGDELWLAKENPTYYTNGTMIFRYKVDGDSFKLVGTIDCDFGHINTLDYCAANDCLIFGNGSNDENTTGNYFVVVKNPRALGSTALIADCGIKYNVDIGFKVQALWGDSNLGSNNIAVLLSNHSQKITTVMLNKNANGEFDGTYRVLETVDRETVCGVQGADIWGDTLYIGYQIADGHAIQEVSLTDFSHKNRIRKFYKDNGTVYGGTVQGIYVDSEYVWVFLNTGDSEKPCFLTKYRK